MGSEDFVVTVWIDRKGLGHGRRVLDDFASDALAAEGQIASSITGHEGFESNAITLQCVEP
jgi:hypothetical protein